MKRTRYFVASSGLLLTCALSLASGCRLFTAISDAGSKCDNGDDCDAFSDEQSPSKPACGGEPTDIDPATGKPKFFNVDCAIFAWAGALAGQGVGTMANPLQSLQEAIAQAKGRWVIACNKDAFTEDVQTADNVTIYGGFDCGTLQAWVESEGKANLTGKTPGKTTLTLMKKGPDVVTVQVHDLAITAPDASAGASSVAVAVDTNINATFAGCDIKAGKGGDGAAGQNSSTLPAPKDGEKPQTVGSNACIASNQVEGGKGAQTVCDDGASVGGNGGLGGIDVEASDGKKGDTGQPAPNPPSKDGEGGEGQTATTACAEGFDGLTGNNGKAGSAGTELGEVLLTGIVGGDGEDGALGTRGQGGGGGGGARYGMFCTTPSGMIVSGVGASGGGGGSGGCGGKGGGGGKAGGSSIAIVSLGKALNLLDTTLATGDGGKGGDGGQGQAGSRGGDGGPGGAKSTSAGSKTGCPGGNGGDGGDGGPGGGGRGGHSIGIAYAATPDSAPTPKEFKNGSAGIGGTAPVNKGADGQAGLCWDFAKKSSCSP